MSEVLSTPRAVICRSGSNPRHQRLEIASATRRKESGDRDAFDRDDGRANGNI